MRPPRHINQEFLSPHSCFCFSACGSHLISSFYGRAHPPASSRKECRGVKFLRPQLSKMPLVHQHSDNFTWYMWGIIFKNFEGINCINKVNALIVLILNTTSLTQKNTKLFWFPDSLDKNYSPALPPLPGSLRPAHCSKTSWSNASIPVSNHSPDWALHEIVQSGDSSFNSGTFSWISLQWPSPMSCLPFYCTS